MCLETDTSITSPLEDLPSCVNEHGHEYSKIRGKRKGDLQNPRELQEQVKELWHI